jgi:hypothetical protein
VSSARLHSDLGDVGHHALDGRIGQRDQLLYVVDLGLSFAQLYRPGDPHRACLAPPPLMALTMCSLSASVAAESVVGARPWWEYPRAPDAVADGLGHDGINVTTRGIVCQLIHRLNIAAYAGYFAGRK